MGRSVLRRLDIERGFLCYVPALEEVRCSSSAFIFGSCGGWKVSESHQAVFSVQLLSDCIVLCVD
jgi:hypothetical protein